MGNDSTTVCDQTHSAKGRGLQSRVSLPDISAHEVWFKAWSATFLTDDEKDNKYIELKRNHTLRVLENACRIVAAHGVAGDSAGGTGGGFSGDVARASLLAALYHDVGRFPQYAAYKTFSDQRSVNHGILGCKTLKRQRTASSACPMQQEPAHIQAWVLASIGMHNRFLVPAGISAELKFVTDVVRDSDKLDIFPVMVSTFTRDGSDNDVVTLHLEEKDDAWSQPILDALRFKRLASYRDMRYVNDFKLLLGSWVFELNFSESRRMLRERGLIEALLATWPVDPEVESLKAVVREALAVE